MTVDTASIQSQTNGVLPRPAKQRLVIHADKLFDGEHVRWDQAVTVEGDRIVSIRAAHDPVRNTADVRAAFVMPGLISTHEHVNGVGVGESGLKTAVANVLALFLRHGVTTLREAGAALNQMLLVERLQPRPHLIFSGPMLEQDDVVTYNSIPVDRASCDDTIALLAHLRKRGVAFAKVYVTVEPDLYTDIVRAARAAGLKVGGHLWKTPVEHALAHGIDILDHVATILPRDGKEIFNPGELAKAWANFDRRWGLETVASIREKGVRVSSTLAANAYSWGIWKELDQSVFNYVFFYHRFLRTDGVGGFFSKQMQKRMRGIAGDMMAATMGAWDVDPIEARRAWSNLVWLARTLHAEGCLIPGADAPSMGVPPGHGMVRELILLEELVGIPALDVLRLATSRAASALGVPDAGAIKEGARADLVLLAQDPLAHIRNLETLTHVMVGGRLFAKEDIKLADLFTPK